MPGIQSETGLPEGFAEFYGQFHKDSLYQINHVTFPLQGIPNMADSAMLAKPFYWEKENWLMHRSYNFNESIYTQEFVVTDYAIEEVITDDKGFGILRRFYFMDGEWKLIYYAGMNRIGQSQ